MKSKISITLEDSILKSLDLMIDGVRLRNRSQAIESVLRKSGENTKIAVIICGGEAKKTENGVFCVCAPLLDETVLEYNLSGLRRNGFHKIYLIGVKEVLVEAFKKVGNGDSYGMSIEYVETGPKPRGSMDALSHLRNIGSTFLVAFGDIIYGENDLNALWNAHISYKGVATIHLQATTKEVGNAGVVLLDGSSVKSFVQKPGNNKLSLIHFSGLMVAEPEILGCAGISIENDVFPKLVHNGTLKGYLSSEPVFHFHKQRELDKINKMLKDKHAKSLGKK